MPGSEPINTNSIRLGILTFMLTVATGLITYAVTVTMAYARLDKDIALERQARENLQRRVEIIDQRRDTNTQYIDELYQRLQDLSDNVEYLNRQLSPEIGNFHGRRSTEKSREGNR